MAECYKAIFTHYLQYVGNHILVIHIIDTLLFVKTEGLNLGAEEVETTSFSKHNKDVSVVVDARVDDVAKVAELVDACYGLDQRWIEVLTGEAVQNVGTRWKHAQKFIHVLVYWF